VEFSGTSTQADAGFSFAPSWLVLFSEPTHRLRSGLHPFAPSELGTMLVSAGGAAHKSFTTGDTEGHRGCLGYAGVSLVGRDLV